MNEKDKQLIALFHTDVTVAEVAKEIKKRTTYVNKVWSLVFGSDAVAERKRRLYSLSKTGDKNPQTGLRGKDTANFKRGYWIRNGYKWVPAPEWYDGPTHAGYAAEHTLIYCENTNKTKLPDGFTVHHLDFNKMNNEFRNLIALSNRDHLQLHAWLDSAESVETISNESRPRRGRPKRIAPEKGDDIVRTSEKSETNGKAIPEFTS